MHSIERYGVVALIFLVVTVVAVLTWDRDDSDGAVQAAAKRAPTAGIRVADPPAHEVEETAAGEAGLVTLRTRPRPLRRDLVADEPADRPARATDWRPAPDRGLLPPAEEADDRPSERRSEPASRERTAAPVTAEPEPERGPRALERPDPRSSGRRVYAVRAGDTLSEIALREVGTSKRWKEIVDLNPGLDPARLKVGARLVLPERSSGASGAPVAARDGAEPPREAEPARTAAAPRASSARHVVRSGESLWLIAQRRLGDGERWKEIVALNPGLNPAKLAVGKELALPEDAPLVADSRPQVNGGRQAAATPRTTTEAPAAASRGRVR